MTTQNLPMTPPALRYVLCYGIDPDAAHGPSLREIDTSGLPDGATAFVVSKNTYYRLKKSSTTPVDASAFHNVVKAANGGNWVRNIQLTTVALTSGVGTSVSKLDITAGASYLYVCSTSAVAGSPGIPTAVATSLSPVTVTVTSTSNTDALVQVIETNYA